MQPTSASTPTAPGPDTSSRGRRGQGVVAGLVPLGALVVIVIVTVAVIALVRALTAGQGFSIQQAIQQGAAVFTLLAGLVVGAAVYTVAGVRALRRVAHWQQVGMTAQANGALWGLALGALVVLLPLLLAIFLPQHPAPILAP